MTERRDDDAKKAILARRAKFVAAAITSLGLVSCGKEPKPTVCLSVEPVSVPDAQPTPTASTDPPNDAETSQPVACLSVTAPTEDAGPHVPRVCLRMVAPPKGNK